MIYFTKPSTTKKEIEAVNVALTANSLSGNGFFTGQCLDLLSGILLTDQVLLTDSCTGALELIALDLDLGPDDEVIVPAYTFVSSALPFANFGAKIVFCDIASDNWNVNWHDVWSKVTINTKAIVVVHYGGVSALDTQNLQRAQRQGIKVIEDAAQAIGCQDSTGNHLGTLGDYGTISFHDTKNVTSGGEGGCLITKSSETFQRLTCYQEKGTDRSLFLAGIKDKYSWVSAGRSALMSELQAAFLSAQLQRLDEVNKRRKELWENYYHSLHDETDVIQTPNISEKGNGHVFNIELENRQKFIRRMRDVGIITPFHYAPLNQSSFAKDKDWSIECCITEKRAARNVRLPLYFDLTTKDQCFIIENVRKFSGC